MLSDAVLISFIAGITVIATTWIIANCTTPDPISQMEQNDELSANLIKLIGYSETQLKALDFIITFIKQNQRPAPPT